MSNDLVANPTDLDGYIGAPFSQAEVDAAVSALRNAAHWHIAPERTETVVLDTGDDDRVLRLPSLRVVSVAEVRDTSGSAPVVIDAAEYRTSRRTGLIRRGSGRWSTPWPAGYEAVEVDLTHGYDECPASLLPLIAQLALTERRDRSVRTVSVDDASTTYASATAALAGLSGASGDLSPYVVPVVR